MTGPQARQRHRELKMVRRTLPASGSKKTLRLAAGEPFLPTPQTRLADRMLGACREHVRFINRHLNRYQSWLELPAIIDNALYLGYTLKVRDTAPFVAAELRDHLEQAGIETRDTFGFSYFPETTVENMTVNGRQRKTSLFEKFCLPCRYDLTILDLQTIVNYLKEFLSRYEGGREKAPGW